MISKRLESIAFWIVFGGLIAARLLLITGIPMQMHYYPHDDLYFAKEAAYLIRGEWMGPYDKMTLIKAPFYAFYLAGSFFSGLPLFLTETLFYTLACSVLFFAITPLVKNRWLRLLSFAVILFIPATLATTATLRIYREFVYFSLTMLLTAFAIGTFLRLDRRPVSLLLWSVGLGLSMGAFMITREEGIWISPVLFALFAVSIYRVWKKAYAQKWLKTGLVLLPVLLWYLPTIAVSALNASHYGFWGTSEQLAPDFNRVVNLLAEIKTQSTPWHPFIQISQEARMKAYAASPLFNSLKDPLEQGVLYWNTFDDATTAGKPKWLLNEYGNGGAEISNAVFLWTLRDAVASAGYYSNGKYPADFYKQLGDELEAACKDGKLECSSSKALPFVGSIDPRHIPIIERMFTKNIHYLLYQAVYAIPSLDLATWPVWPANSDEYRYFEQLTNDPVSYMSTLLGKDAQNLVEGSKDFRWKILPYKDSAMKKIKSVYTSFTPPAVAMAMGIWICLIAAMIASRRKQWQFSYLVISGFLLALFFVRVMMLSIVDATTSANIYIYTASSYVFLYLFILSTVWWFVEFLRQSGSKRKLIDLQP